MSNIKLIKKIIANDELFLGHYFIIGEAKCGTTALFSYLCNHPHIVTPRRKELRHFRKIRLHKVYDDVDKIPNADLDRITDDYLQLLIPNPRQYLNKKFMIGEASGYIKDEWSIKIIKKRFASSKKILLLRNPVDRLYSWYWLSKKPRKGRTRRPVKGFEQELDKYLKVEANFYYDNLKTYSKYFSLDDLLIIKSEDFFDNPRKYVSLTFQHLGLERFDIGKVKPINVGKYEPMAEETRAKLSEHFREQNEKLYSLINRDMGW